MTLKKPPSSASMFHACAGSLAFADALPADLKRVVSSSLQAAADRGTAAHALLELCISGGTSPQSYLGALAHILGRQTTILGPEDKTPGDGVLVELSADIIEAVTVATDYVSMRAAEYNLPLSEVKLEMRVRPLPHRTDADGLADVTLASWPILEVIDYKNGRAWVNHRDNAQVLSYLLGVAQAHGWGYTDYVMTIVQPFAGDPCNPESVVRSVQVTEEQLRAFEQMHSAACDLADAAQADLGSVAAGLITPDAWADKYLAAGDHCGWCHCQPVCKKRLALTIEQAKRALSTPADEWLPVTDIADAVHIAKYADQIRAHVKAAEALVLEKLKAGQGLPGGARLGQRKGRRQWKTGLNLRAITAGMVQLGLVSAEDSAKLQVQPPPELLSAPQAAKLVPRAKRAQFEELFVEYKGGSAYVWFYEGSGPEDSADGGTTDDG